MVKAKAWIRWADLVSPLISKLSLLSNFKALAPWATIQSEWASRDSDSKLMLISKDGLITMPSEFSGQSLDEVEKQLEVDWLKLWSIESRVMPFEALDESVEITHSLGFGWHVEASSLILSQLNLQPISPDIWAKAWGYYVSHWKYYQNPFLKFSLSMALELPYTYALMLEESQSMFYPLPQGRSRATIQGFIKAFKHLPMDSLEFAREWQIRLSWHQKYIEKDKLKRAKKESRTQLLAQNLLYRVQNQFVEVHPWKSF